MDGEHSGTPRASDRAPSLSPVAPSDTATMAVGLLVELASTAVRGLSAASVTEVAGDTLRSVAASDATARYLDEVQYGAGRGPCVTAATMGMACNLVAAEAAAQWPELAGAAAGAGLGSVLSLPLTAGEGTPLLGALTVYAEPPIQFEAPEVHVASLFAHLTAAVVASGATLSEAQHQNCQLQEALASRDLIGQAKGILMARGSCSADQAFDTLRRASQRTNRKLRDVAADLVATTKRHGRAGH
jgi:ANTAR domain/GAF domain